MIRLGTFFWWGSEYQYPGQNQGGYGTRSLFNTNGNVLPVASALGALATPSVTNFPVRASEATRSRK